MAINLSSIIKSLSQNTVTNISDTDVSIAEIIDLQTLNVQGSITHKSLVFIQDDELSFLSQNQVTERLKLLKNNILIFNNGSPELLQKAHDNGFKYVAVSGFEGENLKTIIKALITNAFGTEDRLIAHSMRVLTLIARTGGIKGVLSELSKQVDGWAVLLDNHGHVIESVGAGRLHLRDAVAVVLNKPVRINYPDLQVHVVGTGTKRGTRMVLASRIESAYRVRSISSHAAALLALMLNTSDPSNVEKIGRELIFEALLDGGDKATKIMQDLRLNEDMLGGFVLSAKTKNIDVAQLINFWFNQNGFAPLYISEAQEVYGFAPKNLLKKFRALANEFKTSDGQTVTLGIGEAYPISKSKISLKQAREAHREAQTNDVIAVHFKEILSIKKGLMELNVEQRKKLRSILDSLALSGTKQDELLKTLRVFLRHHGSWSSAAKELGIHRQTLTVRINKIEQLLGMRLNHVDNRAVLWLALRAGDIAIVPSR